RVSGEAARHGTADGLARHAQRPRRGSRRPRRAVAHGRAPADIFAARARAGTDAPRIRGPGSLSFVPEVAMRVSSVLVSLLAIGALALVTRADNGPNHKVKQAPPVKMGTSGGSANDISTFYCCGGTLGSLILRDGQLCILSNNHVLARSGSAVAGEDTIQ